MAQKKRPLEEYLKKRDFRRTSEPKGGRSPSRDRPRFVIQKHDATNLHYDFRLEWEGVLKSWAVPKGPSTDPREKRLALPTEDHPLEYAEFEGVIPEGEYGAGAVLIWDAGTYRMLPEEQEDKERGKKSLRTCLDEGHLKVWLEGEKIRGGYALTRIGRGGKGGGKERWLLVKMDDEEADARRNPVGTEPESVLSGRGLAEIRNEESGGRDDRARRR